MKTSLFCLIVAIAVQTVWSQNDFPLSGQVMDKSGAPVVGALVTLDCRFSNGIVVNTVPAMFSDTNGGFYFPDLGEVNTCRVFIQEKSPNGVWNPFGNGYRWTLWRVPRFRGTTFRRTGTRAIDLGVVRPTVTYGKVDLDISAFRKQLDKSGGSVRMRLRISDKERRFQDVTAVPAERIGPDNILRLALPLGVWRLELFDANRKWLKKTYFPVRSAR